MSDIHEYVQRRKQQQQRNKPECWGDPSEHSKTDPICRRCSWETSCGNQVLMVKRKGGTTSSKKSSSVSFEGSEQASYDRMPNEDEKAVPRLGKNILGGLLRAFGFEIYEFFRRFRIP